jgi:ssDNA-binding Zn-finger/Zn-ribbon topoisomerase 1
MPKKKKIVISKIGHCPKCGSNNLKYDDHEFNGDSVIFNYECKKCNFLGYEEYTCNFIGHSDTYGESFWNEGEETNNE